jgi:hypothetical protein
LSRVSSFLNHDRDAAVGTAIVEGRDRFELPRGTELTVISGTSSNGRENPGVLR